MRTVKSAILFSLLALLTSLPALAQGGVYADFTTAFLSKAYSSEMNGATLGAYYEVNPKDSLDFLRVGADARGTFVVENSSSLSEHVDSYLIGPEVSVKTRLTPLRPYAEILFGAAHENETTTIYYSSPSGSTIPSQTKGEAEFLAGADWTFSPHLAWRIVEIGYGKFGGISSTNFNTGLVLRLP